MSSYPQVSLSTLEALFRLGRGICDEVEKFHPDIVIRLAHSGWMPVVVAQALWAETEKTPFPASMRTNIGHEKKEIYEARYGTSYPAFCCGECCWGEPGRLGHYLAWVAEQGVWQKTLRQQIKQVLPSEPKRILVADDIFGGYRSGYLALALLEAVYPNAEIYMYGIFSIFRGNYF
jgi:hypoxanthine phosphoribosyltransferase